LCISLDIISFKFFVTFHDIAYSCGDKHFHIYLEERLKMQYILTQDELNDLTPKSEVEIRNKALTMARETMLKLANFDCIHDVNGKNYNWYCTDCPCSRLTLGYSQESKLLCNFHQEYGK
jgi:hypothetical protein